MNRFNFLYAICFLLSGLLCGGCSKVGIDTFDETQATVTVPWNVVDVRTYPGYNSLTKTFDQTYSFWSDPEEETMVVNKVGRGRPGLRPDGRVHDRPG